MQITMILLTIVKTQDDVNTAMAENVRTSLVFGTALAENVRTSLAFDTYYTCLKTIPVQSLSRNS